jgi:DnaD/phage-associated family protein
MRLRGIIDNAEGNNEWQVWLMGSITLCRDYSSGVTVLSNSFIDRYMCEANDAQIKIYLYLLRCINSDIAVSVDDMAERFNYSERDIVRALKYWDAKRVLSLSFNSRGSLTCIQLMDLKDTPEALDAAVPGYGETGYDDSTDAVSGRAGTGGNIQVVDFSNKREYTPEELIRFKNEPGVSELLFVAEEYLGKTLRSDEIASIFFMYETYNFRTELIEYLIEYCANNKKKNIKYIESVAKNWAETGIETVEQARLRTGTIPAEVYKVFGAFGISGRNPIEPEISYVFKWQKIYGFSIEMICRACEKTIMTIHSPSFEYTDSILSGWKEAGAYELKDVELLDAKHAKESERRPARSADRPSGTAPAKSGTTAAVKKQGGFNSFAQRKYDYAELEKDALRNQG